MRLTALLMLFIYLMSPAWADDIKIGWIGPLTGNAAILGVDTVPAIQIAFDKINAAGGINGSKLKLVVEDDQYLASKTLAAYEKLVHGQNIKILISLTYGGNFAIAPLAVRDGVQIIDSLDCDNELAKLPDNLVCIAKTTESLGAGIADMIVERKEFPPAVIYYDGDPFMGILYQAVSDRLKSLGHPEVHVNTYNESTMDFRALLAKFKNDGRAKSLVLLGYDQLGLAIKQAEELKFEVQRYGVSTVESPGFQKLAGHGLEGLLGIVFHPERTFEFQQFEKEFSKRVGRGPQFEVSTVPSFDVANIIGNALKNGGWNSNKRDVDLGRFHEFLMNLKNYKGLSGIITMDMDGAVRSLYVREAQFKDSQLVPLHKN